jgi:hypothetical protein
MEIYIPFITTLGNADLSMKKVIFQLNQMDRDHSLTQSVEDTLQMPI